MQKIISVTSYMNGTIMSVLLFGFPPQLSIQFENFCLKAEKQRFFLVLFYTSFICFRFNQYLNLNKNF